MIVKKQILYYKVSLLLSVTVPWRIIQRDVGKVASSNRLIIKS